MAKIEAILVDDEPRGVSSLQKLLQINCKDVDIIGCCYNAAEAFEKISKLKPALVFLDIAMPGMSGFDILKNLKTIDFEVIFVTAHSNYMSQAFHYSAIDYLLKPIDEQLLISAVARAGRRIKDNSGHPQIETLLHNEKHTTDHKKIKLCIPSLKGFQVVEINDIIYCEALSNYTNFHFVDKRTICASKPIHEYEALLEDCNIIRIHKSFLVNLAHVKEYIRGEGGSVVLLNGIEVEVSRRKKELLMTKMRDNYKF